jgi:hypothetical protein
VADRDVTRRRFLGDAGKLGLAAAAAGTWLVTSTRPARAEQVWSWCSKCEGLWFPSDPADNLTVCPRDLRRHAGFGSGLYDIKFRSDGGAGQDNWRWCTLCGGMHFAPDSSRGGVCVGNAGGAHAVAGSGFYRLETTTSRDGPGGQDHWRWCSQCEGLWFAGHATGVCPASDFGHVSAASANYVLRVF